MSELGTEARISFVSGGNVLRIEDLLQRKALLLEADREVQLSPALTDLFVFPVDRAVSFETGSLYFPAHASVQLRDEYGEFVEKLLEPAEYPVGDYLFDVIGDVRTYVRIEGAAFAASGRNEDDSFTAEFDRPTTVTVGSRSLHTRPEATIVVPDEPTAAMEAISYLGSSIKEFSAERSWPTLRGHPPRIRRGDRLEVSDSIERPDTGVRIAVPPEYSDVYRVAPLAFYLGATVEPGEEAALHLENGYTEPLRPPRGSLEETVEDLLKRSLLLDSLVRTEGYIPSKRYEYEELGPELPFYPPNLYHASLSEQLLEYLEVERSVLEPYYPSWSTTAVLRPGPTDIELLPYLAHSLSPVRVSEGQGGDGESDRSIPYGWPDGQVPDRGSGDAAVLTPEALPPNAALLSVEMYENAFDRPPVSPGEATVALVTDLPERGRRWRDELDALSDGDVGIGAVETIVRPDRTYFRSLFDGEFDLVYVALPAEGDEVACADGTVRLEELRDVRARFSVFEAGPSVETVASIVRNGGVAGAVVDGLVSVDRLREFLDVLGIGIPLGEGVRVSSLDESAVVKIVGDPGHPFAYTANRSAPIIIDFEPLETDRYQLTTHTGISLHHRAGEELGIVQDWGDDRNYLVGSRRNDHRPVTTAKLVQEVELDDFAIRMHDSVAVDPERFTEDDVRRAVRRARWDRSNREFPEA